MLLYRNPGSMIHQPGRHSANFKPTHLADNWSLETDTFGYVIMFTGMGGPKIINILTRNLSLCQTMGVVVLKAARWAVAI